MNDNLTADVRKTPVAVLGAGSWGTALAILLARNGQQTRLWGHDPQHMQGLAESRTNEEFLPGHSFPSELTVCASIGEAIADVRDLLFVVPSHAFHSVLDMVAPQMQADSRVAWATKGLEPESGNLLHEVVAKVLGDNVPKAVISGPSFANEVAAGYPTAITVAAESPQFAEAWAERLRGDHFRAYTSDDLIGVELGGSVKNVLAIATGIADGLGYGANTRSALITRGLAEMMRLGDALGGRRETLMGLAGLGDLVLTCTDNQSRNRRFGLALADGQGLGSAESSIGQVVEGIGTAREIWHLAQRHQVDMPIVEQAYLVLHEGKAPRAAVTTLLARNQKPETD